MKLAFAIFTILALCQSALAEVKDCRTIGSSTDRLSCYDKQSPGEQAPSAVTVPGDDKYARPKYIDPSIADDARMKKRMNTICRGC